MHYQLIIFIGECKNHWRMQESGNALVHKILK